MLLKTVEPIIHPKLDPPRWKHAGGYWRTAFIVYLRISIYLMPLMQDRSKIDARLEQEVWSDADLASGTHHGLHGGGECVIHGVNAVHLAEAEKAVFGIYGVKEHVLDLHNQILW